MARKFLRLNHAHKWLWVKSRVTPKWVALVDGNMVSKICRPIPGVVFSSFFFFSDGRNPAPL